MRTVALFACILFITAPATVQAHMCGVENIEAVDSGLRIKFSSYVTRVQIARKIGWYGFYDRLPDQTFALMQIDGPTTPVPEGLTLQLGDTASVANSPEDACTINVIEQESRLGLKLSAYFAPMMPPGFERPPVEKSELIFPDTE